jgi:hypothetical protein
MPYLYIFKQESIIAQTKPIAIKIPYHATSFPNRVKAILYFSSHTPLHSVQTKTYKMVITPSASAREDNNQI